ncbi:MAG: MobA/MobL family protein [Clostridia bacterium]|nr:MobA/MobL family protein [Clostridia bacterium]
MNFIETINKINEVSGSGANVKPVIHFRMEILSRGKGAHRSVVGYAAYCAGTRLRDERDARLYNWSKRKDIIFSKIMLPKNAPRRYNDRKILWNEVEKVEKNKNAQLARTLVIALPSEFSADTQKRVVCNFVQEAFVTRGMCADINLHDNGTGNPHAHIILTMRSMDKDGNWIAKQRKIYEFDNNGQKIYDRTKKQYKCTIQKTNDWDNSTNVELWREKWAAVCNKEFERLGLRKRITHKSYQRQGCELLPTQHCGSASTAMERKGLRTKTGDVNRSIHLQNMKLISDMVSKTFQILMEKFKEMIQYFKKQISQESPEKALTICGELSLAFLNPEYEKPKLPQYTRSYRQYQRKYTRTHSRDFVPSL